MPLVILKNLFDVAYSEHECLVWCLIWNAYYVLATYGTIFMCFGCLVG